MAGHEQRECDWHICYLWLEAILLPVKLMRARCRGPGVPSICGDEEVCLSIERNTLTPNIVVPLHIRGAGRLGGYQVNQFRGDQPHASWRKGKKANKDEELEWRVRSPCTIHGLWTEWSIVTRGANLLVDTMPSSLTHKAQAFVV